jgi:hypothetical protein
MEIKLVQIAVNGKTREIFGLDGEGQVWYKSCLGNFPREWNRMYMGTEPVKDEEPKNA